MSEIKILIDYARSQIADIEKLINSYPQEKVALERVKNGWLAIIKDAEKENK